jgi:2-keto-3-deoxy-L-rhamnonate aldolase RhmA
MPEIFNPVRKRFASGEPVFAMTVSVASPEIAAQAAHMGFDFLWIEMEHSPISLETLRLMVLASKNAPAAIFARVPINELWTAKRVLDAGVQGVVFPFTSTPELAQQAVDACRYPPVGKRGSGTGLVSFSWPETPSYHDSADANVFVIAMIEDASGVEHAEAIAATPGLDALFIGTSDLSFSLGLRGKQDDTRLEDAIAKIVVAAKRNNVPLGRPASRPEQTVEWRKQGFSFFQLTTELGFLRSGARAFLKAAGRSSDFSSKPLY